MRDLERYAKNIRNENRATITTHKNAPKNNEGVDGDIRITTTTTEGVKLFSKYQGQWYSTPLSKHVVKPAEKNKDKRAIDAMSSLEEDGYQILDSGFIIQWGREGADTDGSLGTTTTVTFPKEFPTECLNVTATYGAYPDDADGLGSSGSILINKDQISTTGVQFSTLDSIEYVYWQAIGH